MLSETPTLAMPSDPAECTFVLDTEASAVGASAVLQQLQDAKLRVTEYASQTFSSAVRAYCATHREIMALWFGLKLFRQYLLGRHFNIRTDYCAL